MEKQENWLYFNGRPTTDFGVYISGNGTFSFPEKDLEYVTVPGRSGDLIIDKGRYKNINVSYSAWIAENMKTNLENLRMFLSTSSGYCRLEDTYHPDEYRMGAFSGGVEAEVALMSFAQFTMTFNCKPQRYLKSGEYPINITAQNWLNVIIDNPSIMTAKPLIVFHNIDLGFPEIPIYSGGTIRLNGHSIIENAGNDAETIYIDCELQDCYTVNESGDLVNCNSYVEIPDGFPELKNGISTINFVDIPLGASIEIIPRWWIL